MREQEERAARIPRAEEVLREQGLCQLDLPSLGRSQNSIAIEFPESLEGASDETKAGWCRAYSEAYELIRTTPDNERIAAGICFSEAEQISYEDLPEGVDGQLACDAMRAYRHGSQDDDINRIIVHHPVFRGLDPVDQQDVLESISPIGGLPASLFTGMRKQFLELVNDPHFYTLSIDDQKRQLGELAAGYREIRSMVGASSEDILREGRLPILDAQGPRLLELPRSLPEAIRSRIAERGANWLLDPNTQARLYLEHIDPVQGLSEHQQNTLSRLVLSEDPIIGARSSRNLASLLESEEFVDTTPDGKVAMLSTFIEEQPFLPANIVMELPTSELSEVTIVDGPQRVEHHPFLQEDEDASLYQSLFGSTPADIYTLSANGNPIELILPVDPPNPDGEIHSLESIVDTLRTIGPEVLSALPRIEVSAYQRVSANGAHVAGTARRLDRTMRLYPASATRSSESMASLYRHEIGHLIAFDYFGVPLVGSWNLWHEAREKDGLRVSVYSQKNSDESFAETFELHQAVVRTDQEAEVRMLFPNQFALIDQILEERRAAEP